MTFQIDQIAREIALRRWVLPECLHVPIAAVDENAIESYIGEIVEVPSRNTPYKALLVRAKDPPPIDPRLPIWELKPAALLHQKMQLWVHVRYSRYRGAYRRAFPDEEIASKVLSHAMNRRTAVLMGFAYVRLTPVSRGANSSSAFRENWAVAMYGGPGQTPDKARRGAFIQYAALDDLMLMMNMKPGGRVMVAVNEAQALVEPRTSVSRRST